MSIDRAQFKRIASIAAVVYVLDQTSKAIVRAVVEKDAPYPGEAFFRFVYHENTGVVGGAFRNYP